MNTISWQAPTTPLPMEINPRVVFERLFGRPGTRGGARWRGCRQTAASSTRSRDDVGVARSAASAPRDRVAARPSISTTSARSSGASSAPRQQATDELDRARRAGRRARRRSRSTSALMFDLLARGLPGRPDARLHVHDGPRGQPAVVSRRSASPSRAPRSRTTATTRRRSPRCVKINTYHDRAVRQVPREAARDAGRRRLAARSLADPLRQRHEQQQRALGRSTCRCCWPARRPAGSRATGTSLRRRGRRSPTRCSIVAQKFGAEIDRFGDSTGRFDAVMRDRVSSGSRARERPLASLAVCADQRGARGACGQRTEHAADRRRQGRRSRRRCVACSAARPTSTPPSPTARRRCTGRCAPTIARRWPSCCRRARTPPRPTATA